MLFPAIPWMWDKLQPEDSQVTSGMSNMQHYADISPKSRDLPGTNQMAVFPAKSDGPNARKFGDPFNTFESLM
jgi:hypothetical protein